MIVHKLLLGAGAEVWLPWGLSKLRQMAQRFGPKRYFSEKYWVEGFSVEVRQAPPSQYLTIRALAAVAPPTLPTGVDAWYAVRNAIIPWAAYAAVTLPDVNNWENGASGPGTFTLDDALNFELVIVDMYTAGNPFRSAWWMLEVPAAAPVGCLLTFDNFQSLPGGGSSLSPSDPLVPDLFLNLITTDSAIEPGAWPTAAFDFSFLYEVANNEDTVDVVTGKQYLSKIADYALIPGKTYFLRCDLYNSIGTADDDVVYRLRISITIP